MDETFTYSGNPAGSPGNQETFDGGDGDDTIYIFFDGETAAAPIVTDFTEHEDGSFTATYRSTQNGGVNEDRVTITNIENVHIVLRNAYGTPPNVHDASSRDVIRTGRGDDYIETRGGNDIIDSGKGVDTVNGGDGPADVISKDFSDVSVDILWNIQTGAFNGPGSFVGLEAFGVLQTGSGNDTIVSSSLANNSGLPGNETILTRAGDDVVTVANGIDHVEMGTGNDRLIVDYRNALAPGTVNSILNQNVDGSYSGEHRGNADSGNRTGVTFENAEHFTIYSAGGSDTLVTGDGDDIVWGGLGNDRIDVGKGVDHVDGGGGDQFSNGDSVSKDFSDVATDIDWNLQANTFSGPGSFTNLEAFGTLVTGSGNDTIVSGTLGNGSGALGNEIIFTGAGDDTVTVANAVDHVDLGAGEDRLIVDYRNANSPGVVTSVITQNPDGSYWGEHRGSADSGNRTGVTFEGAEHFTIYSSGSSDNLVTGDGDDIVSGGFGNDHIDVGKGIDHVDGGPGDQFSNGDSVSKDFSDVTVDIAWNIQTNEFSGPGSFVNLEAFGTLVTGSGNDTIVSSRLSNGSGLPGNETIFTGAGDDVVSVYYANDFVDMGAGDDRLIVDYAAFQSAGNIVMTLNESSPGTYSGMIDPAGSSTDVTFAGVEHFTILLQGGHDTIVTGNGDDVISVDIGNDNVNAGAGNDWIDGGGGDDVINGGDGDDYIDGGAHRDTMTGGLGNDIYVVDQANDTVNENVDEGTDEVCTSLATYTLGNHLENLTGLFDASQALTGNGLDNAITGGAGDDTLDGGAGNDVLDGGGGIDTAVFSGLRSAYAVSEISSGVFEIAGPDGTDTLQNIEFARFDDTTIALESSTPPPSGIVGTEDANVLPGTADADEIYGLGGDDFIRGVRESDTIYGGQGNDRLYGGGGNDMLWGGDGNDVLQGNGGDDAMIGGAGNDIYFVNSAGDSVAELAGEGTDEVRAAGISYTLGDNVENLRIISGAVNGTGNALANEINGSNGNNTILGLDGNDILRGRGGSDTIDGGGGNDVIAGNAGLDFMTGGTGADRFVFTSITDSSPGPVNADTIADFSQAEGDRIQLAAIDAIPGGGDDPFAFIGTAAFSGTAGELRYRHEAGTGDTLVELDVDGDGVRDMSIRLTGTHDLAAADFIL